MFTGTARDSIASRRIAVQGSSLETACAESCLLRHQFFPIKRLRSVIGSNPLFMPASASRFAANARAYAAPLKRYSTPRVVTAARTADRNSRRCNSHSTNRLAATKASGWTIQASAASPK